MKCPICGNEMEKGGLSLDCNMDLNPHWAPEEEMKAKGLFASWHREHQIRLQNPDEYKILPREAIFFNAYYCETCEKAVIIMDKLEQ